MRVLKKTKNNHLLKKKYFTRVSKPTKTSNLLFFKKLVLTQYSIATKPYTLSLITKSFNNDIVILPGLESLNPGKILTLHTCNDLYLQKYLGNFLNIKDIPYNIAISNLRELKKTIYIKSPGTSGKKLKSRKTEKINKIQLPSGKIIFGSNILSCFVGKNFNFDKTRFIEGKWGLSIAKTKVITTRGVAMNPVDHPNGGRTKAKQPELSP